MGDEVTRAALLRSDPDKYLRRLQSCRDALEAMVADGAMEDETPLTGVELELNLIDRTGGPSFNNDQVLKHLETSAEEEAFYGAQHELGSFNVELNLPPRFLEGGGLSWYESDMAASLAEVRRAAELHDTALLPIGTIPTLFAEHIGPKAISTAPRYRLLDEQIMNARGDNIHLDVTGAESLSFSCDTIAPEAASTSVQFHYQVPASEFAHFWNTAQAICGLQLAVGANSPYLLARQLWAETRVILFEQGTDTRPSHKRANGAMPRAWFGEKWIDSALDLFDENTKHFAPLLPIIDEEDPLGDVARGSAPVLNALRLHNGTVYRWNRPVYDVVDGKAHLRVENRIVPSGPSPVDMAANMAFYYGLLLYFARVGEPVYRRMEFATAAANLHMASRHGIHCDQIWPSYGQLPARALIVDHLLALAAEGLKIMGVHSREIDRYLGVVEQRCLRGVNGATWQVGRVYAGEHRDRLDRRSALRAMACDYAENVETGLPVHEWSL
ncbi:glutamate--cysteine ligase [Salininema proteolyticum]|uniref:Glutamate--cysteine ligase n=1 Tax=Salininema proteolyticum TaxID=1607685 RepID=A0ABV8TU30_9ACTN